METKRINDEKPLVIISESNQGNKDTYLKKGDLSFCLVYAKKF